MARLLDGRYASCDKVILVGDNLNTRTKGAFYETFEPERARHLVRRIAFHQTPKHGGWRPHDPDELAVDEISDVILPDSQENPVIIVDRSPRPTRILDFRAKLILEVGFYLPSFHPGCQSESAQRHAFDPACGTQLERFTSVISFPLSL